MDAVEYLKTLDRMCHCECLKCEFRKVRSGIETCPVWQKTHPEEAVAIVEKWAKEQPVKTRQSVFLEQFPNVRLDTNEIIDISPCRVDPKQYSFNGKDCCKFRSCGECRREFWLAEVEE